MAKYINPIYFLKPTGETKASPTGDIVREYEKRKVIGAVLSISQTEFWQAQASGHKPEIKIEIRAFEYRGEQKIEYKGIEYSIKRTYEDSDRLEFTCYREINKGGVNNGNTFTN